MNFSIKDTADEIIHKDYIENDVKISKARTLEIIKTAYKTKFGWTILELG